MNDYLVKYSDSASSTSEVLEIMPFVLVLCLSTFISALSCVSSTYTSACPMSGCCIIVSMHQINMVGSSELFTMALQLIQ